jgi:integrase/recombinase XerD
MKVRELLAIVKKELELRNYSPSTIKSYLVCLGDYCRYIRTIDKDPSTEIINEYLSAKKATGLSSQTINLYHNAIKFFYRNVCESDVRINISLEKTPKQLPIVLSKREIDRLINALVNKKHQLLISLSYGAGLRLSEVVNLMARDLDLDGSTIYIKNARGSKGRLTVLPERLRAEIIALLALREKNDYLFLSERGGRYTERAAQKVFEKARNSAKINKDATFQSLRHSFACHLLEKGLDVRYIQLLMGHKNIRTTQVYAKITNPSVRNIRSPLD